MGSVSMSGNEREICSMQVNWILAALPIKLTTGVLIGAVIAVLVTVAEEPPLDAVAVAAGQVVLLADGLVGEEEGLHLLLLGLGVAVLDGGLPVAGLLLNVEGQAGGTADGLETLKRERTSIPHTFF